jgi:hypothetical protein
MQRHSFKPSKKGKGFEQPLRAHEHWHVDVSYINVAGTYFEGAAAQGGGRPLHTTLKNQLLLQLLMFGVWGKSAPR